MRTRKTFSGDFQCPTCGIEEELVQDKSALCEECGEKLVAGRLYDDEGAADNAPGHDTQDIAVR